MYHANWGSLRQIFMRLPTSIISISFSLHPVTNSKFFTAGTGPRPIKLGSTPAHDQPTTRTRGVRLYWLTAASLARMMAPAPLFIPWNTLYK